ncbi:PLP-dependent aspartate aminotransferase family protein [Clostridium sp. MSJ-8]|uniref:trans-sulfuration enzyme family protein n=1 Tax=Clostridium sp. MSJ-8 TaxID=2841510 RepID=UPI001C0E992A|nr:PLP-dependent aspartate aminotransferase family protein [Clostridium sp. MSJ-8]MBU5486925.1 PLP-dependent aspartate aminotransferase family protein [Clostridium sp. MSJ-8]
MSELNKKSTILIHGGIDGDERTGAVNVPIYQTSTYKQISLGKHKGYEYSRTGNPTREALEKLIAELEHGNYGLAFASGMAAITAVLTLFKTGDKILISKNVYGGTFRVLNNIFDNFGISYEIVDTLDEGKLDVAVNNADVKAILVESPANPLMTVTDIRLVANVAHKHNKLLIVDNTFMTPYLQRPLELGADIVVHSATKYLGGHSDLIAGLVVVNDDELAERLYFIQNSTGGVLQPFDSFLLIRGIKTLGVRMDRHEENAKAISRWLLNNKAVKNVYYPGLEQDPGYDIQSRQADGAGAMISFELEDNYDIREFFEGLKIISLAESLGGVESLICHPSSMTHASIPEDIRKAVGITDKLIRLSVGIEDKEDLINDLNNAIERGRKQ